MSDRNEIDARMYRCDQAILRPGLELPKLIQIQRGAVVSVGGKPGERRNFKFEQMNWGKKETLHFTGRIEPGGDDYFNIVDLQPVETETYYPMRCKHGIGYQWQCDDCEIERCDQRLMVDP